MDISVDLEDLAKTNFAVLCASPKSILDIGLMLEYFETKGVPVLGYQMGEVPSFYCKKSGYRVDARMDSPMDIERCINANIACSLLADRFIINPFRLRMHCRKL